ncbi:hypothetical protein NLJ89_g2867 [Agrocybe chaxingu]|uniref:BTB domain-containing protein n=1 Tax=Agrocybe chaxingu TaxID=84603 RepID=A0A9W8KBT7_9AGAR|nr:hypothetical protein NLJ89_g2867 [Agrocybe chaxingu]
MASNGDLAQPCLEGPDEPRDSVNDRATPEPCSELWFNDGSIILQASNVLFRVHRSILQANSEIFHDMLDIAHNNGDEEMIDGLQVVKLADDEMDVKALMKAIYQRSYIDMLSNDNVETFVDNISGILRLSTKYEFKDIRKAIIAALENITPTTFGRAMELFPEGTPKESLFVPAMKVAALAVECNIPLLLPMALYHICHDLPASGEKDEMFLRSNLLSDGLKAWTLSGRARLGYAQEVDPETQLRDVFSVPGGGNCRKGGCSLPTLRSQGSHMSIVNKMAWRGSGATCFSCAQKLEAICFERKRKIWGKLPEFFGLGQSWEDLKKQQEGY